MRDQLAWYVGGPIMGLCVVAARMLFNGRLGVTGGYSELVSKVRSGSGSFDWRGWFAIGVLLGGTLYVVAHGAQAFDGYGWMTQQFHGVGGGAVIAAILLVSGVAIGYGAKTSGGCTSGNGLSGTAMLSPASMAATATFFATGIGVSFLIKALI